VCCAEGQRRGDSPAGSCGPWFALTFACLPCWMIAVCAKAAGGSAVASGVGSRLNTSVFGRPLGHFGPPCHLVGVRLHALTRRRTGRGSGDRLPTSAGSPSCCSGPSAGQPPGLLVLVPPSLRAEWGSCAPSRFVGECAAANSKVFLHAGSFRPVRSKVFACAACFGCGGVCGSKASQKLTHKTLQKTRRNSSYSEASSLSTSPGFVPAVFSLTELPCVLICDYRTELLWPQPTPSSPA
jgi:hypothetical protein